MAGADSRDCCATVGLATCGLEGKKKAPSQREKTPMVGSRETRRSRLLWTERNGRDPHSLENLKPPDRTSRTPFRALPLVRVSAEEAGCLDQQQSEPLLLPLHRLPLPLLRVPLLRVPLLRVQLLRAREQAVR